MARILNAMKSPALTIAKIYLLLLWRQLKSLNFKLNMGIFDTSRMERTKLVTIINSKVKYLLNPP